MSLQDSHNRTETLKLCRNAMRECRFVTLRRQAVHTIHTHLRSSSSNDRVLVMGIKGFSKWFHEKHAAAYVPLGSITTDHLYIDCNSVLHHALRRASSWEEFHRNLYSDLDEILSATAPRKTVMVAIDGPGPLAKVLTQRERRKADANKGTGVKKGIDKKRKRGASVQEETESVEGSVEASVLTGNSITPGTCFMLDVSLSVLSWAASRVSSNKWSHLQIEVSDGTVKGEGEVKILGRIARPWYSLQETDTHVMVGDDADLVIMALVAHQPHTYVINRQLSRGRLSKAMPVMSVPRMQGVLHRKVLPQGSQRVEGCKRDLILLTVMSKGNDYLPRGRGFSLDCGDMWNVYFEFVASSTDSNIVKMSAAKGGRPMLCMNTLTAFLEVAIKKARGANKPWVKKRLQQSTPQAPHAAAEEGDPQGVGDGEEAEEVVEGGDEDEDRGETGGQAAGAKSANYDSYLQGLVWMMDMYLTGECPDYRYTYDGAGPCFLETIEHCRKKVMQRHSPLLSYADYMPLPKGAENPLKPFATALALLPATCAHLLPAPVHPLMQSQTSPIADIYLECSMCVDLRQARKDAGTMICEARLKVEALESDLEAASSGYSADQQRVEELGRRLEAAKAELHAARRNNRAVVSESNHHDLTAHTSERFPVQRLVDAAAQVPTSSFSLAEQPLAGFGRSCVIKRLPDGEEGLPVFEPPSPPSTAPWSGFAKAPLVRYSVQEPTLCGEAWKVFAGLEDDAVDGKKQKKDERKKEKEDKKKKHKKKEKEDKKKKHKRKEKEDKKEDKKERKRERERARLAQLFVVRLVPDATPVLNQYITRPQQVVTSVPVRGVQASQRGQGQGRAGQGAGAARVTAAYPDVQADQAAQEVQEALQVGDQSQQPQWSYQAPQPGKLTPAGALDTGQAQGELAAAPGAMVSGHKRTGTPATSKMPAEGSRKAARKSKRSHKPPGGPNNDDAGQPGGSVGVAVGSAPSQQGSGATEARLVAHCGVSQLAHHSQHNHHSQQGASVPPLPSQGQGHRTPGNAPGPTARALGFFGPPPSGPIGSWSSQKLPITAQDP